MVFPCNSSLPDLSLNIAGRSWTVPAALINLAWIDDDASLCEGGLQKAEMADGRQLNFLGNDFLKTVFAVFDFGKERIGFAVQA